MIIAAADFSCRNAQNTPSDFVHYDKIELFSKNMKPKAIFRYLVGEGP